MTIQRARSKEDFNDFTGQMGDDKEESYLTILNSPEQRNVVLASGIFYVLGMFLYMFFANVVVYVSFHLIPLNNPSSPGDFSEAINATQLALESLDSKNFVYRNNLYDVGFAFLPDRSDRPWWLKKLFVDSMVTIAQFIAPFVLIYFGHTKNFVCYVCLIVINNTMKGIIQIATVLPAANRGEFCWALNFGQEEIDIIRNAPFYTWFYQNWGMTHGCNDMLWSGHTSQSLFGILFVNNSLRHNGYSVHFRMLLCLYFTAYMLALLMCRMHYTIDVLVAVVVAGLLYTHADLRLIVWSYANKLVCNPTHDPKKTLDPQQKEHLTVSH